MSNRAKTPPNAEAQAVAKTGLTKAKTKSGQTAVQNKLAAKNIAKAASKNNEVIHSDLSPDAKKETLVKFKCDESLPDGEYMNEAQLAYFRKVLLMWKTEIMSEVDVTKTHMQENLVNYPDLVDRANQEEGFALELRNRDRERKLLHKIDAALERINDKSYGYCDDCGAEIVLKRLVARPIATQCVECKSIAEVREKQLGDHH